MERIYRPPRLRGEEKVSRTDGLNQLRWAADRRVGRNAKKLADLLAGKALAGDLASAKILVGLAEGKKARPEREKRRRGPSGLDLLEAAIAAQQAREALEKGQGSGNGAVGARPGERDGL